MAQGTLPWVIPCLNPRCCSQHSSPARWGRWHTGLARWQCIAMAVTVLCREPGGGSLSITGLLQGDRAVLTLGLLLCPVFSSKCPKAPLPFSSSSSRAASPQHSPAPQSDASAGHFPPQTPSPKRKQAQDSQPSTLGSDAQTQNQPKRQKGPTLAHQEPSKKLQDPAWAHGLGHLTSEQPGTVPEEHKLARKRLAAMGIPWGGNTSASSPGTAGAPRDEL